MVIILNLMFVASEETDTELESPVNITNIELSCKIVNRTFAGNECIDELKGVGKVIGWIIFGVVLFLIICVCGCCFCICKKLHKKNAASGQVNYGSRDSVISTVA